jgi:lipoprotein-releasing system permease protein
MVAIAVASAAMIILLSVLNGFSLVIKDLYTAFYPDIKISAAHGKFFSLDEEQLHKIKDIKGVSFISCTIQDNALMNNEGRDNSVVTIKGVDNNYFKVNNLADYISSGRDSISVDPVPGAIVGNLIMDQTGMDIGNAFSRITLYYPNLSNPNNILDPTAAFQSQQLIPVDTFRVLDEFDSRYIIAPLSTAQELLQAQGKYSAIEISLKAGANADGTRDRLQSIIGKQYKAETRYEQNRTLYMVMNAEKWAVYAILLLVLIIASFNMVRALSLLVLEKQKDIAILKAMGAAPSSVRSLFICEGIVWSVTGGATGITLGLAICLGQQYFGWIKLPNFVIDAFPVQLIFTDFLLVIVTVVTVGLLAALYPAKKAVNAEMPGLKS